MKCKRLNHKAGVVFSSVYTEWIISKARITERGTSRAETKTREQKQSESPSSKNKSKTTHDREIVREIWQSGDHKSSKSSFSRRQSKLDAVQPLTFESGKRRNTPFDFSARPFAYITFRGFRRRRDTCVDLIDRFNCWLRFSHAAFEVLRKRNGWTGANTSRCKKDDGE